MLKFQIPILFLIIQITTSKQNYQLRQVYYDQNSNICHEKYQDWIDVFITSHEFPDQKIIVSPGTYCETWKFDEYHKIATTGGFQATIDGAQGGIIFNVELTKANPFQIHKKAYTNTTLEYGEMKYQSFSYICQILGDGTVQHFNEIGKGLTAKIIVFCERKYDRNLKSFQIA